MARRVAVIPGEGAAPEAVRATLRVVDALGIDLAWQFPEVGREALDAHGSAFPEAARRTIDACDATLFGATSGASAPALFYLRWGKQTFANVRPARFVPGFASPLARPEHVDLVIVRENLEDLYLFLEGPLADLSALGLVSPTAGRPPEALGEGSYAIKAITVAGSERVIRFAFALARERARSRAGRGGHVTLGAKWNMLPRSDGLFRETGDRIAAEHPDVGYRALLVDDLAHRLTSQPETLDVVVLPNLYGDILSDAAAGLVGGLGLAPSGCYGADYAYFESAHGTAPDLEGKGIVNPTATLLAAAMMLDHLGLAHDAARLTRAVEGVYADRDRLTPDQGGTATTAALCDAVIERLAGAPR
jgi:isocitrate/isopropylmalate dehydrogenase